MRNKLLLLISAVAAATTLIASPIRSDSAEVAVPFRAFGPPSASQLVVRPNKPAPTSVLLAADAATPAATSAVPGPGSAGGNQFGLGSLGPIAVALPTAVPMAPAQAAIALLVPMVISLLKKWIPMHKVWLPIIALGIGVTLGFIDNSAGVFGGNPIATALVGPAGTGLREIYDQVRQLLAATGDQASAPSSKV